MSNPTWFDDIALRASRTAAEQQERLVAAFLAETGLKPSEAELVQSCDGNKITWHMRRRQTP